MMKLKIGITCYPTVGGSGVIATELGKLLSERGHEIHFVTSNVPFRLNKLNPNIYYHEVQVNQYSVFQYPPYDLALASKMAEVAKRQKLDLFHVHYAIPHAVCGVLAKQMVGDHLKIVTTLHGTDITVLGYDPSLSNMIRFGIEKSDRITAVSDHLISQTHELLETNKPIETVYNFVDERVYFPRDCDSLKSQYGIDPHEKIIVHISNFRKVKRVADVIHVFERISSKIDSKLLLIGDGPEFSVVCKLVKEKELEDKVLFLGKQENVEELLSISHLMLLLSEKESFGLVLLEAMACGVPCIGTNVGGIPEVIDHEVTGYLCNLGDIEAIAEKSLDILTDDHLAKKLADHSIKKVREKFSSKAIVEKYERIYMEALQEGQELKNGATI